MIYSLDPIHRSILKYSRAQAASPGSLLPGIAAARPIACPWLVLFFIVSFMGQPLSKAAEYLLPPDSGAVNVKSDLTTLGIHTANATGNGSTDDTAAIQAAINWAINSNARYSTAKVLYFPNGTYRITNTIQSRVGTTGFSSGWRSGMILIGQSTTGTVIKLTNSAAGFGDPASRKSMIITGSENPNNSSEAADGSGNEAFRHQIHNLTIDTGSGNPGAVAVDFNASNRGTVKDVVIRSSDATKAGVIGLELRKNGDGVGPLLIKNLTIDGFNVGIQGQNSTFSSTFENITLKNQKVAAINPGGSMFTLRKVISENSVPVLSATNGNAHVTIIEGTFTGGGSSGTAILNSGKLFLRNLISTGYGKLVDNNSGGTPDVTGGSGTTTLAEFSSHPVEYLFDTAARKSLGLPILETPTYTNHNFAEWANIISFGATKDNSGDDDAPAIQAAIDSGARVIYFPNGAYHVRSPLYIRNNVRMILGFESALRKASIFTGSQLLRYDSTQTVLIRNMNIFGEIVHNSSGSLAFTHCDITGVQYTNTDAGAGGVTFMEDVISTVIRIKGGHRFYARQLNTEHNITEFENNGSTAWLLGFKTEQQYNILTATNGSRTEIFGGHFLPTIRHPHPPRC
ncbi:MAG: hypothetical protein HC904_13390 [Blastochloris sp.]|nr:hypothetical protein [Blastochloris sp.]